MTREDTNRREHREDGKSPATLTIDALESRILLSATWTDGDTENPLDGPTVHNDVFHGSSGRDIAHALDGEDVLFGDNGADQLFGDGGDDQLFGESGNDRLYGGEGADALDGGDGHDSLYGQAGDDTLFGGTGNDRLYGQDGNDLFDGGEGNDFLDGGSGDDQLLGGDGNDRLYGRDGVDTLSGGDGNDRLYGHDGNDQLDGGVGNDILDGGAGDDQLDGGAGNDRLYGRDGVDTLSGGEGNDRLYGHDGNDQLDGGVGNDILDGGSGNDRLLGGEGSDQLVGRDGDDHLSGGAGDDRLSGGDGVDRLDGGEGADRLDGGAGEDLLYGNDGNDRLTGGAGADSMHGGAGNDRLDGGDHDDWLTGADGNDTLLGRDGDDRLEGGFGNDRIYGGNDQDVLNGGFGDDHLDGGRGEDQLVGGDGQDRLYGGEGADVLNGGAGNDRLDGGTGDDLVQGGEGNDNLDGRDGADRLFGDAGNDTLRGGNGVDFLDGGTGNDRLSGDRGDDQLMGGEGNDILSGGAGDDQLDGGAGNDRLDGGAGDDLLDAGAGNNRVSGGQGDDTILSGDGNDTINAGAGDDTVHYYGGNDRIHVGSGDDVVVVHAGQDGNVVVISGGGQGDTLDLSAYRTDQVTVEGSRITVQLSDGGSFLIHARGFDEILTTDPQPLFASAGADLDVTEGGAVTLSAVASNAPTLDFSELEVESYGGSQDAAAVATVESDGDILHIEGNGWKTIDFPYTVTEDTILEFEFRSDAEGEIHGIGFDNDNDLSSDTTFKLFGTQTWGNGDFDDYEPADGWKHYRIRVGDYFTGDFDQLVFANDHDVANATGESLFRNMRVYEQDAASDSQLSYSWEQVSGPEVELTGTESASLEFVAPDIEQDAELVFQLTVTDGFSVATDTVMVHVEDAPEQQWIIDAGPDHQLIEGQTMTLEATYSSALNFDDGDVHSYGGAQDQNASFAVEDDGTTLRLQGNTWKQLTLPYTVTEDTILEFDFRSASEGEIHGIGFDSDDNISADTTFKVHGTQNWGRTEFDNYDGESGEWQHYRIRVGDFFTGDFDNLIFVNDHDVAQPDGEGLFSNIRLYEESALPEIQWVQVGGPEVELLDADTATPLFVAPQVDANSELVFQVTIGSDANAVTDSVTVAVANMSAPEPLESEPGEGEDVPESSARDTQVMADLVSGLRALEAEEEVPLDQPTSPEFDWPSELLDELQDTRADFAFGEPLQSLDRAEELVEVGLSDDGQPMAGVPVLQEVVHLGDQQVLEQEPVRPDVPDDLVPVLMEQVSSNTAPVEIRHPVFTPQDDGAEPGLRDAEADDQDSGERSSGLATLWGLLRGFAGTRMRGGKHS